jgi:hypothetical protein
MRDGVACWVLKTTRPPTDLAPGWSADERRSLTRCVRRSYRLDLMASGQPCLLWLSGRDRPGVHALGILTDGVQPDGDGWAVPMELTLLPDPIPRGELLADPIAREAEVLRMPAGSNPSWLSTAQFAAVFARTGDRRLRPWTP